MLRVFSQAQTPSVHLPSLVNNARNYFKGLEVEVLSVDDAPSESRLRLRLESASDGYRSELSVLTRPATEADYAAADRAEQRGRAGGMSALARRCAVVSELHPEGDVPELALLTLAALLASFTLGPVLPADESTLFGVRGARERVDALRKQAT